MKKCYHRYFIILSIIVVILPAICQAEFNPGLIGKGFKAGVNIANVNNHEDADSRRAYLGGAFANYPMLKNLDFQIELMLVGKGYMVKDTPVVDTLGNVIGSADWSALVTYLELPVMAKWTLPVPGKIRPFINLGGFVSQAINKKERRDLKGSDLVYDIDLNNVKTHDAGFLFGAGVDIKSGNGKVFLEGRYDYSNIAMLKYTKYRSRVWIIQVGYWW